MSLCGSLKVIFVHLYLLPLPLQYCTSTPMASKIVVLVHIILCSFPQCFHVYSITTLKVETVKSEVRAVNSITKGKVHKEKFQTK